MITAKDHLISTFLTTLFLGEVYNPKIFHIAYLSHLMNRFQVRACVFRLASGVHGVRSVVLCFICVQILVNRHRDGVPSARCVRSSSTLHCAH